MTTTASGAQHDAALPPDLPVHAERGGSRKDADWDLVTIPEDFGPTHRVVTRDKRLAFAFAQGDYGSWYFQDSPFGGPVCHPMIFANDLLFLFYENYDGNTAEGLHTHEQLTFHSPARPGELVTFTGQYVEKFVKRGQGYVVLRAEARGEDGRLIVTHRGTEIMRTRVEEVAGRNRGSTPARAVEARIDESLPVATRAAVGIPERTGLPPVVRHFTQDQMNTYSWLAEGYRNVHTDHGRARDSGSERTVVQALQQTGLVVDAMVDFFGPTWFTTGALDLRYVNPAYCGERLTARAAVLGLADDGRLELEVWVEKDGGERTVLGWARAEIGQEASRPVQLLG